MKRPFYTVFTETWAAQRDYLILWAPVFFAGGIGTYFGLKFEPPFFAGTGLFLLAAGFCILAWPARENSGLKAFAACLAMAAALYTGGFAGAQLRTKLAAS